MAMMQEEERHGLPEIIQIDIDPPLVCCHRCHTTYLEGVYWLSGQYGWRIGMICAYCRVNSRQQEDRRLILAAAARDHELSLDPLKATVPRARLEDGQLRCSACGSTTYREVALIRSRGLPAMYVIETLCWMAGHVVRAIWRQGSPIKKRFPTSDTAPTIAEPLSRKKRELKLIEMAEAAPLASLMPTILPPAPINEPSRGVAPVSMRRIIQVNEPPVEGCDERCETFRYIDPDDLNGPVYIGKKHSPDAHNAFGSGTAQEQMVYEWDGLRIDFSTLDIYWDGVPVEGKYQPTPKEWKILRLLSLNNGSTVTQTKILAVCWGPDYNDQNATHLLRVNMARLRPKLARDAGRNPERFIVTKTGMGYMMRQAKPAGQHQNGRVAVR